MGEINENCCGGCGNPVFQAEGVPAGGKKYHKGCHKCCSCGKLLSTTTANLHGGELHCRTCHANAIRPASPALFGDTSIIKPENEAQACPKCKGSVFEAEKIVEKGKMYHKRCYVCCKCSRPQDDKLQVFIGFDQQIYCAICYPKIHHTPLPVEINTGKIKADDGSGCPRCLGKVFDAEKMVTKSGTFHKMCFSCELCKRPMDYSNFVDHEKNVYCKQCYRRNFDVRSRSVGPTGTDLIKGTDNENCPRCGGAVFEAEKIITKKHFYHKGCISCLHCKASLQASTFFDAPDGDVYCKACYAVLFGHKRARSVGPSDTTAIRAAPGDASGCLGCGGKVFEAEKMSSARGHYHASCFKCSKCSFLLDSNSANSGQGVGIFCNGCFLKVRQGRPDVGQVFGKSHVDTTSIAAENDEDGCPRCGGKVFEAEKRSARSGNYHQKCFTCLDCHRILDSFAACNGPDGDIFCKSCYNKHYHVTELRVAESDKAMDTSIIKPEDGCLGCPRCGGKVFHAEEVNVKGRSFHAKCCTCKGCAIRLDSLTLNAGPDRDIYCKTCYAQAFGQYRFTATDPALVQAEPGSDNGCGKCGGKVYDLEKVSSKNGAYHKQCFACHQCKRNLDSTLVYAFEAPDNNIYCKKCFHDSFGEGATPLIWADTTSIQCLDGKGCPRCGGAVYKAEEIVEKGRNFHKRCFTCKKCKRPQGDKLQVFVGFDEEIYCKGCYPNLQHTPLGMDSDTSKITGNEGESDVCPRCKGKVFEAEKFSSKGKLFHKKCFSCFNCHSILSLSSMFETPDKEICCKTCYIQCYFTGGKNAYLDYSKVGQSQGEGPACPNCKATVFEAEKVVTKSHHYHKKCLSCFECSRLLDSSSYFDGKDTYIYCKHCYATKFGHMAPSEIQGEEMIFFPATPSDTKCTGCSGKVFEAEKMLTSFGTFHRQCYKCSDCSKMLDTAPAFKLKSKMYCKTCFSHARDRARDAGDDEDGVLIVAKAMVETATIKADEDDPDRCPRCWGKVFEAEKMKMKSGSYHKNCFRCGDCRIYLDYSLASDGPTGDVFCKNCYGKNFGPLSRNMESATAMDTAVIKPTGDNKGCPRCGGAVFKAEEIISKGVLYHKKCANCIICQKILEASSLCAGHGTDMDIYCSGCYAKKYGDRRPTIPVQTNTIKAMPGDDCCIRCDGKIFEAERYRSKTALYHKKCFSCKECSKSLESTLADITTGPDCEIYCKKCNREKFGVNRTTAYADPKNIIAIDGEGCPRCNGKVFTAEQVVEKGRNFHISCFTCKSCKKPLNDKLQVHIGFDEEVYCKNCYPKIQQMPTGLGGDPGKIKGEAKESCPRCEGKVFENEKMRTKKRLFHKQCFNCRQCSHPLNYNTMNCDKDGEIFCKTCYLNIYFTSGKNFYMDSSRKTPAREGDPEACLKCKSKVFQAEKVMSKSGPYHSSCLSCNSCNRLLDSSSFFDGPGKTVYCKNCYATNHGHRSRSKSRGPIDYSQFQAEENDPDQCKGCKGKIFGAEQFSTCFGSFHLPCFKCNKCNSSLHLSPDSACNRNGKIMCKQCFSKERSQSRKAGNDEEGYLIYAKSVADSHVIPAQEGDPDRCPRCTGKVFDAERMSMKSGQYHKKCFSCFECKRPLDYTSATDSPHNEVYCRSCYTKCFGPQTLILDDDMRHKTDIIKPTDGSGCPRCGGAVFEAERVIAKGTSYHKKCARCFTCNCMLNSLTLCDVQDGSIYCNGCYGRKFGGASYRGAQTQNWVDGSNVKPDWVNPGTIKCEPGDPDGCKKCQGKVYDLERVACKKSVWHKACFNCNSCRTSLNSTLVMAYEAPDDQVYCKSCYKDRFGEGSTPLTYTDVTQIKQVTEDGCVRCSGVVFEAEKVKVSDRQWFHKSCFSCMQCKGNLDILKLSIGPGGEVFCKSCYRQLLEAEKYGANVNTDTIKASADDKRGCPRCGGKVFEAEKVPTKSRWFHKSCFCCNLCKHKLDCSSFVEGPNDEIFCHTCYAREYNASGRNRYGEKSGIKAEEGDKSGCLRCGDKVFSVDKVLGKGGVYHRQCLSCAGCSSKLNASNFSCGPDGDIYCRNCYLSTFGSRGRAGSLSGPTATNSILAMDDDPDMCPRCGGKVFEAEKMSTSVGPFHRSCFRCVACSGNLNHQSCNCGNDGEIYCKNCYQEEYGTHSRRSRSRTMNRAPSRAASRPHSRSGMRSRSSSIPNLDNLEGNRIIADSMSNTTSIKAKAGDKDGCPRCGGKVFEAEKMVSSRGVYHKKCFSCEDCKRALDSNLMSNGPVNTIYCNNCYMKSFGPTVRQFNEEEARRFLESTHLVANDTQKGCPRCKGRVYPNEELYSAGRSYHKKCAKCASCARQLDFNTIFDGSDKDIYCKGCYGRKFGTAGFRGILSSSWTDESSSIASRPSSEIKMITTDDDKLACIRCRGKVFEAEKVVASHGMFHRSCYSCADCNKGLEAGRGCDAPNREVYCKACYGNLFGLHGYGFGGFGSVPALTAGGGEVKTEYHYTQFF